MRTKHTSFIWAALALGVFAGGCGDGTDDVGSDSSDVTEVLKEGSPEALAVLALVNDPAVTSDVLDDEVGLDKRAAQNIAKHRAGPDRTLGTDDDDFYDSVKELDAVSYVGSSALKSLLAYAKAHGYLRDKMLDVVFSPQPIESSHNARIAQIIDGAQESLDIAMYSFSDNGISSALERAVQRGVKVRFVFETASADRRAGVDARPNTKSGRLENIGVDVRWVNKIMHHKFVIVDGPRDDADKAGSAIIASGSGNWSNGAATRYDENTLFLQGYPEMAMRMQREFNHLWEHSKDFDLGTPGTQELSTLQITDEIIPEDPTMGVLFTSANFDVNGSTFSLGDSSVVAEGLVAAIHGAKERIHIASGHLRSRPVAEALMGKRQTDPDIDIKVYLDGQEYISEWAHSNQEADLNECLANASTDAATRKCTDKGFLFGYQVGNSDIEVKYKYYAYRWDNSYALQMHNKFMIIDDALYTGSYNLSDNAEHATFENMMMFDGPEFVSLVDAYEDHFQAMWVTGEGLLDGLTAQVQSGQDFPIVFEPMALDWAQVTDLKELMRVNCPDINSDAYRKSASSHKYCDL
jgi:phosphatidylserine/phosphatidylglycerophosphate/cardiolipin synthase-like enzyme